MAYADTLDYLLTRNCCRRRGGKKIYLKLREGVNLKI
jgi:hypothetical protein